MTSSDLTRRELLEWTAAPGGPQAGGQLLAGAAAPAAAQGPDVPAPLDVVLRANGTEHRLTLDPRTTTIEGLAMRCHQSQESQGFVFTVEQMRNMD